MMNESVVETPSPATSLPTIDEIKAAQQLVYEVMPPTPQIVWPLLCERLDAEVWVKHENHTPIGAFKARTAIDSPRMTDIIEADSDQDDESLIEPGQMVVTITRDGFIKRTTLETFRAQNRGGRGRSGASTRGDDIVTRSFHAHTHQWVLFFSSGGKAFRQILRRRPRNPSRSIPPPRLARWT